MSTKTKPDLALKHRMEEEALPCPICKKEEHLIIEATSSKVHKELYKVYCSACIEIQSINRNGNTISYAISRWNDWTKGLIL